MNRRDRRALEHGKQRTQQQPPSRSKIAQALSVIDGQIAIFVKQIVEDVGVNPDTISFKLGAEGAYYKILLCNGTTNQIVGKAWGLQEFMLLCSGRRLEMELNIKVRQMILTSQDKCLDEVKWL